MTSRRPDLIYLDRCRQECAADAHERFRTAASIAAIDGCSAVARIIRGQAHTLVASYRFYHHQIAVLPLP